MASGESFDPRTWQGGDATPVGTPVTAVEPAAAAPVAPPVSYTVTGARFRWWLAPLLSAAVLAGGACAAYATRSDAPAVAASAAR